MDYTPSTKPTRIVRGKTSQWWTSWVHLIPIGLTGVLLWLSYSTKYWFSPVGLHTPFFSAKATNVLNWLQLAAKLYEIFVISSMAAITLKAFKRIFVNTGVPFGLLTGAYRVGDIMYLATSGFWRALLFDNWRDKKIVALAALIITNTLLSILVGPASAILIVPELDWFPLPNAFSDLTMPIFYNANADYVWPNTLNDSRWADLSFPYCRLERATIMYQCPAAGFSEIYNWAAGWDYSALPDNITFPDQSGTVSRRLDMRNDSNSGTFITTPTALTASTFGQFQYYIRSKHIGSISNTNQWKLQYTSSSPSLQPLVQAKCNIWNTETTKKQAIQNMTLPNAELECFSEEAGGECHKIREQVARWTINTDMTKNRDNVTYTFWTTNDGADENSDLPSTLMFIAGLPYYDESRIKGVRVVGCSYLAHWIPTVPGIDPGNTNTMETNITKLEDFFTGNYNSSKKRPGVGSVISIDKTWLPYMDVTMTTDGTSTYDEINKEVSQVKPASRSFAVGTSLLAMMMTNNTNTNDFFGPGSKLAGPDGDDKVKQVIEKFTGSIVADAIARMSADAPAFLLVPSANDSSKVDFDQLFVQEGPNAFDYEFYKNGSFRAPTWDSFETFYDITWSSVDDLITTIKNTLVTVDFNPKQYGYGFGQPGPPMRFALTVIITYIGILILYCICVLIWGGKTVVPWDDLQDLLALAWSSAAPPELKGQGAQIVDKQLWKESVSVRATSNDHVSLALGDEQPFLKKLGKGESYY